MVPRETLRVILVQRISKFTIVIVLLPVILLITLLSFYRVYYALWFLMFLPFFRLSYEYSIQNNFKNFIIIRVFGIKLYQKNKLLMIPEYISLNHQGYKEGGTWMWYPTIFGNTRYKLYTIKFFKGNKCETVFKTSNREEAVLKANELSKLLNVRINNTLRT